MFPVMMLIMNVATVAIIWFGSVQISNSNGSLQPGGMIAFLQYAIQIMFALLMFSMMFIMVPRAAASATRINEVLDIEPEITDAPVTVKAEDMQGYIEFQDVTFSYPGAEEPALNNISFKALPGQVTAIIGGTGSGKSTLVNLIPRFYDIDSGQLLVDGVDTRKMTQDHLRSKIGFVPQKAVLFSGSINENIRFGKNNADIEDIRHAAEVAQGLEFISEMKDGFESEIAQGGSNVSGGQKQRLSIARALVRKPEIYVFDDSFSALDFKTDARLRSALRKETSEATVIIVAQRVSTVMDADQIIVLEEGRLAGLGTHRELMKTCEVYREIVSSQLSVEEIAEEIA
jgi:ATP-binding cassette subfamily B protein